MNKKRIQQLAGIKLLTESIAANYVQDFHHTCLAIGKAMVKYNGGFDRTGNYKDRRIAEFKKLQLQMEDLIEQILHGAK